MLRELRSLKLKLGIVILAATLVTAATTVAAVAAGLPSTVGAAAGVLLALGCVQVLARGTTAPLREMAAVASAMAAGEQGRAVEVTTADEVGELARAFNRMTAQLAETNRLRRDVIANVSHELRTPLGALQATLENVVEGVSEPDPQTLATMLAQTKRLGRLVAQLLDLSRLEAGEQRFHVRPFVVRDILESAAREARLHAPPDVVFAIDTTPDLRAAGDPEPIHQVVANLVENAVRFSPRPGCVTLRAAGNGATVSFVVEDEGPGIAGEEIDRVFERFRRGRSAARRRRRRRARPRDRPLDRRAARRRDPRRAPRSQWHAPRRHAPAGAVMVRARRGAGLALALALALGACGEDRGEGVKTTPAAVGTGASTVGVGVDATVPVSLVDFRLPRNVRVSRGGLIAFEATNDGQSSHALAVIGPAGQARTQTLKPGERTTVEVRLPPGTYKWYCPVADHERRGMVGRVRVAE